MAKQKYYTVWRGRKVGVYDSWEECKTQVHEFEGAIYKSFPSKELAEEALLNDSIYYIGTDKETTNDEVRERNSKEQPILNSLCVDGAWNTKTNAMEYQGVLYPNRERVFHAGPFDVGTNNIAEFLGIVHALTYCKNHPKISFIYSDSHTAITWVKKKKAATKIQNNETNANIIAIVNRAEKWLLNNDYKTRILKWETKLWGENPADFGRK
jgi:ribonuclease HI